MEQAYLFVVLIIVGVVITIYGLQSTTGRRQPKMNIIERPLIAALQLKNPNQTRRVLGRVRVVYGMFFVIMGIWGLL